MHIIIRVYFYKQVWVSAVGQNLSSIGIAFGMVISFASYNRYDNNILVDTVTISLINGMSSFAVGLFTYATLGAMAKEYGKSVENVMSDGKFIKQFCRSNLEDFRSTLPLQSFSNCSLNLANNNKKKKKIKALIHKM